VPALFPSARKSSRVARTTGPELSTSRLRTVSRVPLGEPGWWSRWTAKNYREKITLWLIAAVVLAVAWELIARLLVRSPLFFPPFTTTVDAAWTLYVTDHNVYNHLAQTLIEAGVGFLISLAGVPLGLLAGLSRRLMIALEPINSALYSLPHIALVPLAIVWFGLGIKSKVFIVFISCFFLIMINVSAGVVTIGRELQDVARTYQAGRLKAFTSVILPGSVPFIFAALQLSVGRAFVGVVAAELFASNKGFGYLLGVYGNNFETANLFVIIASFAVMGAVATVVVGLIGRRFEKWRVA
jgi:ABC-type nitrate/sulfonate/bicarbonate transport system permease component